MAQTNDKLKSMIGELLNDLGKENDEQDDDGLFLDQQSKPYLSRMESFAKKDRTKIKDVFDNSLGDIENATDDVFSHSPKLRYLDTQKKNVFVGMGFGSVIGFDDEEGSSKGGLFDDVEDEPLFGGSASMTQKKKPYTSTLVRDYSDDIFGDKNDSSANDGQPSQAEEEEDLDAGLDKLLEGRRSQKSIFAFGPGILSEKELIRSHVASHRTKDEIAAILAAVPPETMSYDEFLSKFAPHKEMNASTMRFINSIIGPNGDGQPPVIVKGKKEKVDYIFYGTHRLDERCKQFFDEMQENFLKLPSFYGETEERILCARDCFEQYVMERIATFAFKFVEVPEEDTLLLKRMKVLSFLTPESLEIKPEYFNESLLREAMEELRQINSHRTPGEKVECVVKSVTTVFKSLSVSNNSTQSQTKAGGEEAEVQLAGADDFLPLFIWVVMRSNIPKLCSNCAFIESFLNPARMISKSGYCLINLRSAINFVNYVDPTSIKIDPDYFYEQVSIREKKLGLH